MSDDDLLAAAGDERRATLDCTSGWYTIQDWQGIRVGDLFDEAGVDAGTDGAGGGGTADAAANDARWVRFVSVTG